MSDCSVEPLNICLDKSQFHFSQDFKSDGRRKKSRYYMSAPCCCWVPFSSLEIKNVHSHKLERRLVLPFYSKDELHIAHEVWNVLIKQCKPLTFMSYYTVTKANSHPWELTLTLINASTLAGGGEHTQSMGVNGLSDVRLQRAVCICVGTSVREEFNTSKEFIRQCTAGVSSLWRQPCPPVCPAWGWPKKRGQRVTAADLTTDSLHKCQDWASKLSSAHTGGTEYGHLPCHGLF